MIDVFQLQKELQTSIFTPVHEAYPECAMLNAFVSAPPKFPCVVIVLSDNGTTSSMRDSSGDDNFHDITLTIDVYSNLVTGKKTQTEAIMNMVRGVLLPMNFRQISCRPASNLNDATVYRLTATFTATVDNNNTFYYRR